MIRKVPRFGMKLSWFLLLAVMVVGWIVAFQTIEKRAYEILRSEDRTPRVYILKDDMSHPYKMGDPLPNVPGLRSPKQ